MLAAAVVFPSAARAVDTVEPFGKGVSDLELYIGAEGFGRSQADTTLGASFQLGYGLTERLSAYLNGAASSDTLFRARDETLRLGLYWTLVDTRHLDLDLFLDFRLSGHGLAAAGMAPGVELNLDLERSGLFLTAWEVVASREPHRTNGSAGATGAERSFDTELGVGGYWTVAEGHQLLALYSPSMHHVPESGEPAFAVGRIALGYNVVLREAIELINEVDYDLPQGPQSAAFGVSTGLLVTLR